MTSDIIRKKFQEKEDIKMKLNEAMIKRIKDLSIEHKIPTPNGA